MSHQESLTGLPPAINQSFPAGELVGPRQFATDLVGVIYLTGVVGLIRAMPPIRRKQPSDHTTNLSSTISVTELMHSNAYRASERGRRT